MVLQPGREAPADPRDQVATVLSGTGRRGRPLIVSLAPTPTGVDRDPMSARAISLWTAKTANYVVDELGLAPGDTLALALPCHWQAWVWLLAGVWSGVTVVPLRPGDPLPADASVLVTTAAQAAAAPAGDAGAAGVDVVAMSLLPLAVPGPVPAGTLDYDTDVRAHGDRFSPSAPAGRVALPPAADAGLRDAELRDAAGAVRAATAQDAVLLTRLPSDAATFGAVWSALVAGAGLVLAPGLSETLATATLPASVASALVAEGCTLAGDDDAAAALARAGATGSGTAQDPPA
ncbi:MAG: TIGR03089 family protein [Kineosporiaceae bacterium]